jgi:hypothetical protein
VIVVKALYTLAEVGRLLGCSRQTVSRWAKKGLLTTIDFAGEPRVPLAALKGHPTVWASIELADEVNARRPAA